MKNRLLAAGRSMKKLISPEDRVRSVTDPDAQIKIDERTRISIHAYAYKHKAEISRRILRLEQEWDIERWIELNASALAFAGVTLGLLKSKKWLLLPAVVSGFLFQHATEGWCPPIPLLRYLGVRTRQEICQELYALKALRGDFEAIGAIKNPEVRAQKALDAALFSS